MIGDAGGPDDEAEETVRRRRRSSVDSIPLPASAGRITTEFTGPPLRLPDESQECLPLSSLDEPGELRLEEERPPSAPAPSDEASIPPAAPQGALGLVERSRATSSGLDLIAEMRERFDLDDYTGALRAAELVLGRTPDHPEAQSISERSRVRLEQHYLTRLGALSSRPRVTVKPSEIRWLGLDHRGGFLLSRIDGAHSIEELTHVSGMPRLETLKTLVDLLRAGAIAID